MQEDAAEAERGCVLPEQPPAGVRVGLALPREAPPTAVVLNNPHR